VGEKHTRATLSLGGRRFGAIRFGSADPLPSTLRAVYKLDVNEFQGTSSLQLMIDHVE
jgi:single-stranded-DNA-specific exonuclease